MGWVVRMRRTIVAGVRGDLTGVRKRVCPIRRIYAVQLARNSVTCRLRMPERFPAHGNPQAGYTDLTDVDDHRTVRSLRRMVSCPGRMMGMRLMRIMHIIVGVVQIVRRVVNVVMGAVDPVVRAVNCQMGIVTGQQRMGQPERVSVSLITISDGWTAAVRHVIAGRSSLRRR